MTLSCRPIPLRRQAPTPALQNLLEEAALSRAALAACAAPVVIIEAIAGGYAIRSANRAFEQLTGHSEEALRGRELGSTLSCGDWPAALRAGNTGAALECQLRTALGQSLLVELIAAPLRTAATDSSHWVITLVDRTVLARLHCDTAAAYHAVRPADRAALSRR